METFDVVLPPQERYGPSGGAIATVVREVTAELARRGAAVRVVGPAVSGALFAAPEVALTRFGDSRLGPTLARVRDRLTGASHDPHRRYHDEVAALVRADRVVVHNDARLAARLAGDGHAVTLWLHNLLGGVDAAALSAAGAALHVVAVSDYVRRWTTSELGVPADHIAVVHNGVDAEIFRPDPTWRPGPRLRVVSHGRIDPNKGQLLAAQAVARLRRDGVPVDLTVVGAPQTFGMPPDAERAYLDALHHAADAAGARMAGRIPPDRVPDVLRAADVAVLLPTVPDPFPLAGLEAMAAGCAVVAVPLGGVDEMVGDAALRVEPAEEAVADALRTLASDADLLRARRAAARERALGFTWARSVDAFLAGGRP